MFFIFWALLRVHFNPRLTARAKMSLSRAQNIFMPANINSIVLFFIEWTEALNYLPLYFEEAKALVWETMCSISTGIDKKEKKQGDRILVMPWFLCFN